jgi:WD40 repeat protein
LLTYGFDSSICLWNSETGERVFGTNIHQAKGVWSSTFTSDGKWIVIRSMDDRFRVVDVESGEELARTRPVRSAKLAVQLLAGESMVLVSTDLGKAWAWDLSFMTATDRPEEVLSRAQAMTGFRIDEDGKLRVIGKDE